MRKYTKEIRQRIIDDYISRHGEYSPTGFLREVRQSNGTHPAWAWFEWQDHVAAEDHRLWQARAFVQGLTIRFEVVTQARGVSGVVQREMPAYISPVAGRANGGGYVAMDPDNPEHMAELSRQGAAALATWLQRYEAAAECAGGDTLAVRQMLAVLERAAAEAA